MMYFAGLYGPDTLDVMSHALKEAMDVSAATRLPENEFKVMMSGRIMAVAAKGERDLDALKQAALSALEPASKSAA